MNSPVAPGSRGGYMCLMVMGRCIYIQLMINYWCTWPHTITVFISKYGRLFSPACWDVWLLWGFFFNVSVECIAKAFYTFPNIKTPLLSVYFENPEQGLSLFLWKWNHQTVNCLRARSGCKHRHTTTPSNTLSVQMPSTCLRRPTGNSRMLILDVKSEMNVKLNTLCHLRGNRRRLSKGGSFSGW